MTFDLNHPKMSDSMSIANNTMSRFASELARQMARLQDDVLRKAISNHLGRDDWKIQEVAHRLRLEMYAGSDMQRVVMDNEPILAIGPIELNREEKGHSSFLNASRGYKILNEPNDQMEARDE